MKLNISYPILIILTYFFIFLISEVNSQDDKLREIEDKFSEINSVYQNITEIMTDVKYNLILKYRYSLLKSKKEKIEKYISKIKSNSASSNTEQDITELDELIIRYKKSCNKFISLNDYFENWKNTIIKIIKIFCLTVIIIIVLILIISSLVYYYFIRKRKSYDILKEETTNNHFYYQNSNDSELVKIKPDKIKKKKKTKKNKKKKNTEEDENEKEVDNENNDDHNEKKNEKEKNENIEVLDE